MALYMQSLIMYVYVHNEVFAACNTYHLLISTSHEWVLEAACLHWQSYRKISKTNT